MAKRWTPRRGAPLSPREREVLCLIAAGRSDLEIGEQIGLAPQTVYLHCNSLRAKTGAKNRVQLARYAVAHGLVSVAWSADRLGELRCTAGRFEAEAQGTGGPDGEVGPADRTPDKNTRNIQAAAARV